MRADQQLRGSSRGPDWGLSSEGKDLTQKLIENMQESEKERDMDSGLKMEGKKC